jgi:hypothetical protein
MEEQVPSAIQLRRKEGKHPPSPFHIPLVFLRDLAKTASVMSMIPYIMLRYHTSFGERPRINLFQSWTGGTPKYRAGHKSEIISDRRVLRRKIPVDPGASHRTRGYDSKRVPLAA